MFEGLASVDALTGFAIGAKAVGYLAALLAMGGALFVGMFANLADAATLGVARRMAVLAALIGSIVLVLRFAVRAARISGMGLDGAIDPMMLGFVWDSPLGSAAIWRGAGEAAIVALVLRGPVARGVALIGAVAVAASYTLVGHTLGEPRWLLAALLTVHLWAAAFWVGALIPLRHAAAADGAALLHQFGIVAAGIVALLVAVGVALAWLLSGSLAALFVTAYGWTLLAKVFIVAGLLGLAALNKLRLVPALRNGRPGSVMVLRRSIAIEGIAVVFIVLLTAALTTITTPPVNL